VPDYLDPEREVFKEFAENKSEIAIHMLNLIKLNETGNTLG